MFWLSLSLSAPLCRPKNIGSPLLSLPSAASRNCFASVSLCVALFERNPLRSPRCTHVYVYAHVGRPTI
jgi:hypothetical protein